MGVISSATLKCPTKRAKKTICCSRVNIMFSACVHSLQDQYNFSNHLNLYIHKIKSRKYLAETMLFSFILHKSNWQALFLQSTVNCTSLIWGYNLQNILYFPKLTQNTTNYDQIHHFLGVELSLSS